MVTDNDTGMKYTETESANGMNKPLISVITVVFNDVKMIEKTILSVINQTYPNVEYIVVDGGSTDGTVEVVKKYSSRISCWISEPDTGIYNAMNKGVRMSHGMYCNFMNSGDFFYDNDVLAQVFTDGEKEDIISGVADVGVSGEWRALDLSQIRLFSFYISGLCHQATFIKRKLLLDWPYDEKLRIVSDSKFFIQALILNNCTYLPVPVKICVYDINGISSNQLRNKKELHAVFTDLFPSRVVADYEIFTSFYNPFFRLLYPLVNSSFFQSFMAVTVTFRSRILKLIRKYVFQKKDKE